MVLLPVQSAWLPTGPHQVYTLLPGHFLPRWFLQNSILAAACISESECRSVVSDSATPWTVQYTEFSRPEYWSGQPFPSPGDLPDPGVEPRSPTLHMDSLPAEPPGTSV